MSDPNPPDKPEAQPALAASAGSASGTLRIEIDFKEPPFEYGGVPHLRMMRAIESVYPNVKNRTSSRMSWHAKTPTDAKTLGELKLLQRQVESAIAQIELGNMVPMTEQERVEYASRFEVGAFVVGDFVIKYR